MPPHCLSILSYEYQYFLPVQRLDTPWDDIQNCNISHAMLPSPHQAVEWLYQPEECNLWSTKTLALLLNQQPQACSWPSLHRRATEKHLRKWVPWMTRMLNLSLLSRSLHSILKNFARLVCVASFEIFLHVKVRSGEVPKKQLRILWLWHILWTKHLEWDTPTYC